MPAGMKSSTWLPVDVRFPRHRKVVALPRDLRYRHIEAMCHCREHDTGGQFSHGEVEELMRDLTPRKRQAAVDALIEAGLWRREGDGYAIHGWDEWNGAFDATRKANAGRQQAKRERDKSVTSHERHAPDGGVTDA